MIVANYFFRKWRHWQCVTPALILRLKALYPAPNNLPGYEDVKLVDQRKIDRAWDKGSVATPRRKTKGIPAVALRRSSRRPSSQAATDVKDKGRKT